MNWMFPSSISVLIATLIMALVYWYLYALHRDRYLKLWAASWSVYSLRYLFLIAELTAGKSLPLTCGYQIAAIVSAILLIWGTQLFSGARFAKWWIAVGTMVVAWSIAANSLGLIPLLIVTPIFCLLAFADFQVGYSLWKRSEKPRPLGVTITAVNFFLWGIHKLDYPLLRNVEWFAPVGYLLGGVFAMVGAMGMVLIFFERMRASMAKEEERLRKIMDCTSDSLYLSNPEGVLVEVNLSAAQKLGYEKAELIGKSMRDVSVDFDEAGIKDTFRHVLEGENVRFLVNHRKKDGSTIPVELVVSKMDLGGRSFFLGSARDLSTEQLLADERRKRELFFRDLLMASKDGFMLLDMGLRIVEVNARACSILGYSREELLAMSIADVDAGMTQEAVATVWDKIVATGEGSFETRHRRKDGNAIDVEVSTQHQPADGGRFVSFLRDITERKRAEENLTWELQVNETLAGLANSLIEPGRSIGEVAKMVLKCAQNLTRSEHGFVSEIDPVTFANVGHTLTEMMGDTCRIEGTTRRIAFPRSPDGTYASLWGQCLNTGKPFFTNSPADHPTWKGLPKEHIPLERFLSVPALYGGKVIGEIALANPPADYTAKHLEAVHRIASLYALALNKYRIEQKRDELETQLLQSQKMEAVGQLAGGVAHDFNNILQVISGYSTLLQMDDSLSEKQKSEIEQIASSADKAAQLTRGLLAFSRKQALVMRQENLNDIIQHVHKFLARIIGEDISLSTSCYGAELPVVADKGQIEQVLMNLATNARDAMPGGGVFSVKGEMVLLDASFTDFHQNQVPPGRYALLTVSDTGSGISKEYIDHIFEPFFTTKEVGKGTGLGMAIIYGIIKQHNGFINVYSEPGQGTTFRIYLPIHEAGSTAIGETVEASPLRGGNETILVAEDEPSVRALVSKILTSYGYTAILAEDGDDAVEKFTAHRDRIALLLLDVIMPKKNGRDAYEEIRRIVPDMKVLFTSGYTADFIESRGMPEEGVELIMKPVQPMELLRMVREMLDR